MVLGWSALVLAVGAITFVVVGNAGRGVGRASAAEWVVSTTSSNSTTRTPMSTLTPTSSSTSGPATPPAPTPESPESPESPAEGSSWPSAAPGTRPSSSDPAAPPDSPAGNWRAAPTRPAPEGDQSTASFTSEGGIVVASCERSKLSLDSIRPRDGWRFSKEVERTAIEVAFRTPGREVEMMLSCVGGVPTRARS
jgi:hypothetical protein